MQCSPEHAYGVPVQVWPHDVVGISSAVQSEKRDAARAFTQAWTEDTVQVGMHQACGHLPPGGRSSMAVSSSSSELSSPELLSSAPSPITVPSLSTCKGGSTCKD